MIRRTLMLPLFAGAALSATSAARAVECFSIYDARNSLVYQTSTAPIDLSRSIEDQMARRFPARYLVIADVSPCGQGDAGAATTGVAALLSNVGDNARPADISDYAADPYSPPVSAAATPMRARGTARSAAGRR